jgi:hypothetical protein
MGLCAWVALQQLKNAEKRQPAETAPTIRFVLMICILWDYF